MGHRAAGTAPGVCVASGAGLGRGQELDTPTRAGVCTCGWSGDGEDATGPSPVSSGGWSFRRQG